MARILITGSADGLGFLAAKRLIELGHEVVVHARNPERARQVMQQLTNAKNVLIGDLSSIDEAKALALKANATGKFDTIIHNAGVYNVGRSSLGRDGFSLLLTVNSLAPYILTCLMKKPSRLIYLTSGMHLQGDADIGKLRNKARKGDTSVSYSDTKLHEVILCKAFARKWPDVYVNVVNPGWVPTRMGGAGAPDKIEDGYQTQVWLAVSDDEKAKVSGCYFHHMKQSRYLENADPIAVQDELISLFAELTGVNLPDDQ